MNDDDEGNDWPGRPPLMDFGSGVTGRFSGWHPDRGLNPQYAHLADVERAGMSFSHPRPDDLSRCGGFVTFDLPGTREVFAGGAFWRVESWEPLTLSPSLLCRACGRHGFIRGGLWAEA